MSAPHGPRQGETYRGEAIPQIATSIIVTPRAAFVASSSVACGRLRCTHLIRPGEVFTRSYRNYLMTRQYSQVAVCATCCPFTLAERFEAVS